MKECNLIIINIFLIIFLLFITNKTIAQDIQFSQYYSAPIILAPSFAGISDGTRLAINYRDQWRDISPGTFVTYAASFDHYIKKFRSGVGLMFLKDVAGSAKLGYTDVGVTYSYHVPLDRRKKVFFIPGVMFKYTQRNIEVDELIFGYTFNSDETEPTPQGYETSPTDIEKEKPYPDAAASALFVTKKYWGGFTVDHLFRQDQSLIGGEEGESKIPFRFSVYGGTKFYLDKKKSRSRKPNKGPSITATFLYKIRQNIDQFDIGAYYHKEPIVLGLHYRGMFNLKSFSSKPDGAMRQSIESIDAVVFLVGYKIKSLSIGYSYDLTISKLINQTGGSHEVSIIYEFDQNNRRNDKRSKFMVPCPMF